MAHNSICFRNHPGSYGRIYDIKLEGMWKVGPEPAGAHRIGEVERLAADILEGNAEMVELVREYGAPDAG